MNALHTPPRAGSRGWRAGSQALKSPITDTRRAFGAHTENRVPACPPSIRSHEPRFTYSRSCVPPWNAAMSCDENDHAGESTIASSAGTSLPMAAAARAAAAFGRARSAYLRRLIVRFVGGAMIPDRQEVFGATAF